MVITSGGSEVNATAFVGFDASPSYPFAFVREKELTRTQTQLDSRHEITVFDEDLNRLGWIAWVSDLKLDDEYVRSHKGELVVRSYVQKPEGSLRFRDVSNMQRLAGGLARTAELTVERGYESSPGYTWEHTSSGTLHSSDGGEVTDMLTLRMGSLVVFSGVLRTALHLTK